MAGKTPICPVQTAQIFSFGTSDSKFGQEQNSLDFVFKRTCVSNPIINSKSWAFKTSCIFANSIIKFRLKS